MTTYRPVLLIAAAFALLTGCASSSSGAADDAAAAPRASSDGTPAAEAGIRSGDQIVEIEGRPTTNMTIDDAVAHINALETQIKQRHPEVGWCFVEPDVVD